MENGTAKLESRGHCHPIYGSNFHWPNIGRTEGRYRGSRADYLRAIQGAVSRRTNNDESRSRRYHNASLMLPVRAAHRRVADHKIRDLWEDEVDSAQRIAELPSQRWSIP